MDPVLDSTFVDLSKQFVLRVVCIHLIGGVKIVLNKFSNAPLKQVACNIENQLCTSFVLSDFSDKEVVNKLCKDWER